MKHFGLSHQEVASSFGISIQTVTDWLKMYQEKGISELIGWNYS
jgi:transposase